MPNITGPFDPFWSFVDEDMQLLYDNGLNGLRLEVSVCLSTLSTFLLQNQVWNDVARCGDSAGEVQHEIY